MMQGGQRHHQLRVQPFLCVLLQARSGVGEGDGAGCQTGNGAAEAGTLDPVIKVHLKGGVELFSRLEYVSAPD